MISKGPEGLGNYVARVLKEKRLSLYDVQVMSGWKITDGYVSSIIRGRATNPTIEKLRALARGLGVDEDEIFRVARGASELTSSAVNEDPWHAITVLRLMEEVLTKPDLKDLLEIVIDLSEEDRAVVRKTAESLSRPERRLRRRRGSI